MKKRVFFRLHLFQKKAAEDYFQKMAQKGWMLSDLNHYMVTFTKEQPETRYYYVGIEDHNGFRQTYYADEDTKSYREFVEGFGYHFVCGLNMVQVFESKEQKELYSDPLLDQKMLRKAVWRDEFAKTFLRIILLLFLFISFKPRDVERLASNSALVLYAVISVLFFASLLETIPFLCYLLTGKQSRSGTIVKLQGSGMSFLFFLSLAVLAGIIFSIAPNLWWILLLFPVMLLLDEFFRKKNIKPGAAYLVTAVLLLGVQAALGIISINRENEEINKNHSWADRHISESVLLKSEIQYDAVPGSIYVELVTFKRMGDYCQSLILSTENMELMDCKDGVQFFRGEWNFGSSFAVLKGNKMVIAYGEVEHVEDLLNYI